MVLRAFIIGLVSTFGWTPKTEAESTLPEEQDSSLMIAQREYYAAQAALRQAEDNFKNATSEFIVIATDELNIAMYKADTALRKLRIMIGIPLATSEEQEGVQAMRRGLLNGIN